MVVEGKPTLYESNSARVSWEAGGVARNVAEALARLGEPGELIAAVGNDATATGRIERTRTAGVGVEHMIRVNASTGIYCSIVDSVGTLVMAASDMQATDLLTVRMLASKQELMARSDFIVLDGNLPAVVTGWVLDFAAAAQTPVVLDSSVPPSRPLSEESSRPAAPCTPSSLAWTNSPPSSDEPSCRTRSPC